MEEGVEKTVPMPKPFRILINCTDNTPGRRLKTAFVLLPNERDNCTYNLEESIIKLGGDVLWTGASMDYAVTILNEKFYLNHSAQDYDLPLDTFSSAFLYAVEKNQESNLPLPNLNQYRLTPSKYQTFDANNILFQRTKWSDLVPLAKPSTSKLTAKQVVTKLYELNESSRQVKGATNQLVQVNSADGSSSLQESSNSTKPQDQNEQGRLIADDASFDENDAEVESLKSSSTRNRVRVLDEIEDESESSVSSVSHSSRINPKRLKLVSRAVAGSGSASTRKPHVSRSAGSITKTQVGYSNEQGRLSADDVSFNQNEDVEVESMKSSSTPNRSRVLDEIEDGSASSVSSGSHSSRITPKRPKLVSRAVAESGSASTHKTHVSWPAGCVTKIQVGYSKEQGRSSADDVSLDELESMKSSLTRNRVRVLDQIEDESESSVSSVSHSSRINPKRLELVSRAVAGSESASTRKPRVSRPAGCITKTQVGYSNEQGRLSASADAVSFDENEDAGVQSVKNSSTRNRVRVLDEIEDGSESSVSSVAHSSRTNCKRRKLVTGPQSASTLKPHLPCAANCITKTQGGRSSADDVSFDENEDAGVQSVKSSSTRNRVLDEIEDESESSVSSVSHSRRINCKRLKLVPRAVAGPLSASTRKPHVSRSAGSITKAQVGYSNDQGWLSADDVSFDENGDTDRESVKPSSTRNRSRALYKSYSVAEGQQILDLICDRDAFMFTKGKKLWQQMEMSQRFPNRTHQSLKEHWRKKVQGSVLKNEIYKITPANLTRLKRAMERTKWTQHANICPDYEF